MKRRYTLCHKEYKTLRVHRDEGKWFAVSYGDGDIFFLIKGDRTSPDTWATDVINLETGKTVDRVEISLNGLKQRGGSSATI